MLFGFLLVFLGVGFSPWSLYVEGVRSWCNATLRGQSAEVVCHFSENIQQFTVWHYPPNRTRRVVVLICGGEDGDKFDCPQMEPGYDIDKRLSDSISLYIPNATYARGGRYECHVIGEGNRADPCELEINGKPDPPYDITVSNSTDESFTVCWTPAYDKGLQQGFRVLYRPAGSRDNYTAVDVCPPSANCFRVNDLTQGSEYEISVVAVNEIGVSEITRANTLGKTRSTHCDETYKVPFICTLILLILCIVVITLSVVFYIHKKKRKTGSTTDPKSKKNPGHYEAYLPMSQREKHQYDTPCVSADPENGLKAQPESGCLGYGGEDADEDKQCANTSGLVLLDDDK